MLLLSACLDERVLYALQGRYSTFQANKPALKPEGSLDRYVQRTPQNQPITKTQDTATAKKRDSYPYFCYTPSSRGKLITADMVTKSTYPFVDLASTPHLAGKTETKSKGLGRTVIANSAVQIGRVPSKATSTVTLADIGKSAGDGGGGKPGKIEFHLSPSELEERGFEKAQPSAINKGSTNAPAVKNSGRGTLAKLPSSSSTESKSSIRNWLVELPGPQPAENRSRSPSEESKDSISRELNYFRYSRNSAE